MYNENNNFLHARIHPTMVLIKMSVSVNKLKLSAPNTESITFPISFQSNETVKVRYILISFIKTSYTIETMQVKENLKRTNSLWHHRVWGDEVTAFDCGDEVALWLSQYIFQKDSGARLAQLPYPEVSPRVVKSKPGHPWMKTTDGVINYTIRFSRHDLNSLPLIYLGNYV